MHGVLKIENEVTNKVFKVNGHKIKLFHESPQMEEEFMVNLSMVLSPILCYDAPWMEFEEFPSPCLSYVVPLFAFCYMLTLRTMCILSVAEGLEKFVFCFLFCFSFFFFLLFCFLFFCICFVLSFYYFYCFTYRKINKQILQLLFLMFLLNLDNFSRFS